MVALEFNLVSVSMFEEDCKDVDVDVDTDLNAPVDSSKGCLGVDRRKIGWGKAVVVNVNAGDAMKDDRRRIGMRLLKRPDLNKFIDASDSIYVNNQ